jgi:transcriptional regulator with XRE-family HTH domain
MAVHTQRDDRDVARQVAGRLREQRRQRQMTLKEVASRVSVSIATLSAIENHQVSPDVDLLVRLAETLDVPVDSLLPRYGPLHFQITRHATIESHPPAPMKLVSRTRRAATPYHNRLWLLADSFAGRYLEPFEIEVQAAPDDDLHFISHHHEEFVLVLRGTVEILIKSPDGLVRETLSAGDCICFWSYLPHAIRSTTDEPARSVHVQCSLDEPADSGASDSVSGPVIYLREAPHRNAVEQIAGKLIHLRQAHGMSAAEFARHLGLSTRRLVNIEQGRRPIPLKLLLRICHTFRKPPQYFFAGTVVDRPFYTIARAEDIRRRAEMAGPPPADLGCVDGTFTPLAAEFGEAGMEPALIRLRGSSGNGGSSGSGGNGGAASGKAGGGSGNGAGGTAIGQGRRATNVGRSGNDAGRIAIGPGRRAASAGASSVGDRSADDVSRAHHRERSESPALVTHAGQEFIYVLHGTVRLETRRDEETITAVLSPGDSCLLDASVPHRFAHGSLTPYDTSGAEILAVFWRPPAY